MVEISRVCTYENANSDVFGTKTFTYYIYIRDVPGSAKHNMPYVSIEAVNRAAIIVGKALGFPVFDGTDGGKGKEIWTPPKPKLVYPQRRGRPTAGWAY